MLWQCCVLTLDLMRAGRSKAGRLSTGTRRCRHRSSTALSPQHRRESAYLQVWQILSCAIFSWTVAPIPLFSLSLRCLTLHQGSLWWTCRWMVLASGANGTIHLSLARPSCGPLCTTSAARMVCLMQLIYCCLMNNRTPRDILASHTLSLSFTLTISFFSIRLSLLLCIHYGLHVHLNIREAMKGDLSKINQIPFASVPTTAIGTGYTPEGIDQNPVNLYAFWLLIFLAVLVCCSGGAFFNDCGSSS